MKNEKFAKKIGLVVFLACVTIMADARIWRVNNVPGVNANFTSLQAAHNSTEVQPGDTIHLESSPNSYGNLTCSKRLIIIGPGYFLGENPNTQAVAQPAIVGSVTLNVGSEGTVIMGCDFNGSSITIQCNDIVIRRNKFTLPSGNVADWSVGTVYLHYQSNNTNLPVSNINITQNYGLRIDASLRAHTNLIITNNFIASNGFEGDNSTGINLNIHPSTVAIVQHNIFRRGRIVANNCNFSNNIMVRGSIEGSGNLLSNNIANASQFGNTNGNQQNVDMTTVFVGSGSGISTDGQWRLKAGSPAIGAGFGSTAENPIDCGMYGGNTPYVLSGMPPVPSIYFFENQPVGSNTDPIDVRIKVKSNN
jgi:hypothetical protein